jgi:hypothetical protein
MSTDKATELSMCLILSTGRCGSTLLSDIVRAHPDALSVSELFSALSDHDLSERPLSGARFWEMLSTPSLADLVGLRSQIELTEMLYPAFSPRPGANRFNWTTGLPPLMQATLPHLTTRPDDLYALLESLSVKQQQRLLSEHLHWLFDVLAANRRPAVTVERSGGSLAYAAALLRLFPNARVVHLFRDGRECAVSMSRHARYKMAMIRAAIKARFGYDMYAALGKPGDNGALPVSAPTKSIAPNHDQELAGLTPDSFTRAAFEQFDVPLARYGGMWSRMIMVGLPELPSGSRLLRLDYADLVARPAESIGRFLEFLGLARDPVREHEMVAKVKPARDVRSQLCEEQWSELTRACRPGMNRLYGRSGWQ